MKHWYKLTIGFFLFGLLALPACDAVKKAMKADVDPEVAAVFFNDLYANVFETSCYVAACHDGNFEPDFTTPQSAYHTLVMHDIIKNSFDNAFTYRVVPYDTASSLLYERVTNCCFVNQNDQMPVLMEPLTDGQIDSIATWILMGAPNWNGEYSWKTLPATASSSKK